METKRLLLWDLRNYSEYWVIKDYTDYYDYEDWWYIKF